MSDNFTVIRGGKAEAGASRELEPDARLDLNRYLVRHPAATFFVRVSGASMTGAQINQGDLLIVDRAVETQERRHNYRPCWRRVDREKVARRKWRDMVRP